MKQGHVAADRAPLEIDAIVSNWAGAWNRHDMEAAAALVTSDVDFINVFGRWLKGRAEFAEHHRRLHCVQMRNSTWINLNHEIRFIHGDLAIVHLEWTIEGDQDPDGTPRGRRKGLFTWVLSREDDGWLIMAAHNTNLHPAVGHRLTPAIGL